MTPGVGDYRRAGAAGLVSNGNAFEGYRLTEAGARLIAEAANI